MADRCREGNCAVSLDGIDKSDILIINGSDYQRIYSCGQRLCDCMVLILRRGLTLAAIELKGGKSIDMRHAIDQIQNGLTTANEILEERAIRSWVPLLFCKRSA